MSIKKEFSKDCYSLLKKVPLGKVTTYKEIARALGTKAYRAVGNAMHKNPHAPYVPCHRVVKSNGSIGGFAQGNERKKEMLLNEGVEVIDGMIDLKRFLFRFDKREV